jgi:hypothetical protein
VGAAFGQADDPDLGEGAEAVLALGPRTSEGQVVGLGIGHVETGAVDAHQPPALVERPLGSFGRQRHRALAIERLNGLNSEPRPRLEQRGLGGDIARGGPAAFPRQALDQHAHDLFVGALAEERETQNVVNDHARQQQALTLLGASGLFDYTVDQIGREHPGVPARLRCGQTTADRSLA